MEGKSIQVTTDNFGAVSMTLVNEKNVQKFISDPGLIKAFGDNSVSVSLDMGSRIIQFVINGIVNDGGSNRQFGWSRFEGEPFEFGPSELIIDVLQTSPFRPESKVKSLCIYNRPLLNTEIIGNHRANASIYNAPIPQ